MEVTDMDILRKARIALTPRNVLLRTLLNDGVVVLGKNRKGFGGRGIYLQREKIEPEFEQLSKFVASGDVFIDVGANTGIYTLRAAKLGATVIAMEPFPDVAATLAESIAINRFRTVRLRTMCAGAQTGETTLWLNDGKPNSFSMRRRDEKADSMSVLSVAIDELLRWEGIARLDYLKIDAEGAEDKVIAGAFETIKAYRPIVQMEVEIANPSWPFVEYAAFRARGSPNVVRIAAESHKVAIAESLGWEKAY